MEKHKVIIICVMWGSAAISSLGSLWVALILAVGAIYITHHLLKLPI